MKSKLIKVPKLKKPKIKKRKLMILLILLILLAIPAGSGISKGLLAEKETGEKKTETVREEQSGEEDKPEKADTSDTGHQGDHLASDFIKTLESGKYAIKYKTTAVYEGQSYDVETTYAVSGDSVAMISGDRATIVRDDIVYMLNHADRTIISWIVNKEKGSPKKIDTEGLAYLGSSEEGGLVYEEYAAASSYLRLYFKEKELVKLIAETDGQDLVMNIVKVDEEAPDTLFEVPPGYSTTNI